MLGKEIIKKNQWRNFQKDQTTMNSNYQTQTQTVIFSVSQEETLTVELITFLHLLSCKILSNIIFFE